MAKYDKREQALLLRKKNYPYSYIQKKLGVSKSTLSRWLGHLPLSKARIDELRGKSEKRIELFRNTMRAKRQVMISQSLAKERNLIGILSKRDLKLISLALYWAEGTKTWDSKTEITNSDPMVLATFIRWMIAEGVPLGRIKIALPLYETMNPTKEIAFWSRTLRVPQSQFYTPRIKRTSRVAHTGRVGHGTCQVIFGNRAFNDRVQAGVTHLSSLGETVK